jgi:hypothetical protein
LESRRRKKEDQAMIINGDVRNKGCGLTNAFEALVTNSLNKYKEV